MSEVAKVNAAVARYGKALSGDVATCVDSYHPDGIFYGYNVPVARGSDQIKATYEAIFNKIQLNVNFDFHGTVVSGDLAIVTTSSAGKVKIIAADVEVPEANRELFYMRKNEAGEWKIQVYMFNKSEAIPADPEGANGKDAPFSGPGQFSPAAEAVNTAVATYGKALSASDAEGCVKQYSKDGIFYGYNLPTATGTAELTEAYKKIFEQVQLNVNFNFEGTYVGDNEDVAVCVTSSAGKVKVLAPNLEVPETNREIFFLKKEDGEWKISHYMFNKAAAPGGPSDA